MPFPFAIFRASDAPLLDDTGMMGPPEFVDEVGAQALASGSYREKSTAAQRVTVPFCQQGEGGMSLLVGDFDPGFTVWRHSHSHPVAPILRCRIRTKELSRLVSPIEKSIQQLLGSLTKRALGVRVDGGVEGVRAHPNHQKTRQ